MKRAPNIPAILLGAALAALSTSTWAQPTRPAQNSSAKQDMKNAGHDTKKAAKSAGHGIKKGTKKVASKTKNTTKGAVNGAKRGAQKPAPPRDEP